MQAIYSFLLTSALRNMSFLKIPSNEVRALDREPKESILGRFDVTAILRYFPEFEREMPRYLSQL